MLLQLVKVSSQLRKFVPISDEANDRGTLAILVHFIKFSSQEFILK